MLEGAVTDSSGLRVLVNRCRPRRRPDEVAVLDIRKGKLREIAEEWGHPGWQALTSEGPLQDIRVISGTCQLVGVSPGLVSVPAGEPGQEITEDHLDALFNGLEVQSFTHHRHQNPSNAAFTRFANPSIIAREAS